MIEPTVEVNYINLNVVRNICNLTVGATKSILISDKNRLESVINSNITANISTNVVKATIPQINVILNSIDSGNQTGSIGVSTSFVRKEWSNRYIFTMTKKNATYTIKRIDNNGVAMTHRTNNLSDWNSRTSLIYT